MAADTNYTKWLVCECSPNKSGVFKQASTEDKVDNVDSKSGVYHYLEINSLNQSGNKVLVSTKKMPGHGLTGNLLLLHGKESDKKNEFFVLEEGETVPLTLDEFVKKGGLKSSSGAEETYLHLNSNGVGISIRVLTDIYVQVQASSEVSADDLQEMLLSKRSQFKAYKISEANEWLKWFLKSKNESNTPFWWNDECEKNKDDSSYWGKFWVSFFPSSDSGGAKSNKGKPKKSKIEAGREQIKYLSGETNPTEDLEKIFRYGKYEHDKSVDTADVETFEDLSWLPEDAKKATLAAVKSGQPHLMFYGPPGTGKTTLAEAVAKARAGSEGVVSLTASSAWTVQDLVGGYQPLNGGEIGFVPGVMLQDENLDRPLVIDELNRCPIDKVLGPMFSLLTGNSTSLPYRKTLPTAEEAFGKGKGASFLKIEHAGKSGKPGCDDSGVFKVGPNWGLLCAINQMDKTQLSQLSFALSRRFVWIRVGGPAEREFVSAAKNVCMAAKVTFDDKLVRRLAALWQAVNKRREFGGAPFVSFVQYLGCFRSDNHNPENDPADVAMALNGTLIPLLDGLRREVAVGKDGNGEADSLASDMANAWFPPEEDKDNATKLAKALAVSLSDFCV